MRKRLGFTNRAATAVLAEDFLVTVVCLGLCILSVRRNFDGSLPYLSALIALVQVAELFACFISAQLADGKVKAKLACDRQKDFLHQRFTDLEAAGIAVHGFLHARLELLVRLIQFKEFFCVFVHFQVLLSH